MHLSSRTCEICGKGLALSIEADSAFALFVAIHHDTDHLLL